jgi:hypothetical protein
MLLIDLITLLITALAVPPCLIATIIVFSKIRAIRERFYNEQIGSLILKTLREEKNTFRELHRCEERGRIFQCLVICISLATLYYVHT